MASHADEFGVRKIPMRFYRSKNGSEPVRDWLRDLEQRDRNTVGQDLMRAQFSWPAGMPLCKPLGQGLWEIRTTLPSRRIARVLLCFHESELWALHAFIKKTQKTPDEDMALGRQRMKDIAK